MLVFDNNNEALILESIHTPTVTDHIWVLDLEMSDFTLAPLFVLEEIVGPAIEVRVLGFTFALPPKWNILVVDDETSLLDVVEVKEIAGKEFKAFVYGPNFGRSVSAVITANDLLPMHCAVGPSLNKHQMMCHPISPDAWICVSPSDTYNKYLKNKLIGDII